MVSFFETRWFPQYEVVGMHSNIFFFADFEKELSDWTCYSTQLRSYSFLGVSATQPSGVIAFFRHGVLLLVIVIAVFGIRLRKQSMKRAYMSMCTESHGERRPKHPLPRMNTQPQEQTFA